MLEITNNAAAKLREWPTAVRVAAANGCGGPRLNLFLDEIKGSDETANTPEGVRMIIDQELLALCGTVKVDFMVTPEKIFLHEEGFVREKQ